MKNQSFFLLALTLGLFSFLFSNCKDEPSIPTEGLVAYYPFNGNAQDESGLNNHGNPNNGVQFIQDRHGKGNRAAYFDGVDDFIKVPHSGGINFGVDQEFTISLWVKYGSQENTTNRDNYILSKWNGSTGYPFTVRIDNQNGTWHAGRYDGPPPCHRNPGPGSGPSISDQQFHHIVFVRKAARLFGYTNGTKSSEGDDNTFCETKNDAPLYIGARDEIGNVSYTGAVDDLRIYNRALNESEIKLLFEEK
jgi:hypothetical protein